MNREDCGEPKNPYYGYVCKMHVGVAPTRKAVGVPTVASELSMAFVYILKSESGAFYIGSTLDINQRVRHHAGGYTPSTKRLGRMRLVLTQEYSTLKEARGIERQLKKLKRKDYIKRIVADGYIKLKSGSRPGRRDAARGT